MNDPLSAAGWCIPIPEARKAHYFLAEQSVSLCGRWTSVSEVREDFDHESTDNCIECKVRRLRHLRGAG